MASANNRSRKNCHALIVLALLQFVSASSAGLPGLAVARERLRGSGSYFSQAASFPVLRALSGGHLQSNAPGIVRSVFVVASHPACVADAGLPLGAEPVSTDCFY